MKNKYLIVGLGNYGNQYINTRHNVGFLAMDQIEKAFSINLISYQFHGYYQSYMVNENTYYFARPYTYMNLSGTFIGPFLKYYQIPLEHLIVIYDDVDLKVGQ